ncbi:ester cyclase [Cohnella silvisoli]|uniref:Ester cyclase n=1 Tax=Cohnella silvisoli TaxID=2873699 RepID=A0ABV1KRC3_9BACL|nr:ester cyclase [Cohnella silvisoli]MCD9022170.1 ester cyclase [Cohnella silvisoli]
MSKTNPNIEIVRGFIKKFWNDGDFECVAEWLTEDYVDHAYVPGNREGLLNMARILHSAFPDQSSTEENIVAEGDRVVVRLRMTGTHQGNFRGTEATNHPIDVRLYREYRILDGKIAEHWALFDTAALLRQIGAELNEQPACRIDKHKID